MARVTYQVGGVTYTREYFASHPDQVLVVRLTADHPRAYTGTVDLTDMHGGTVAAAGSRRVVRGRAAQRPAL